MTENTKKAVYRIWSQGAKRRRLCPSWDSWEAEFLGTEGDMFEIGTAYTLEEARALAFREWDPRTSKNDAYKKVFVVERITDDEEIFEVEYIFDFWGEMIAESEKEEEDD